MPQAKNAYNMPSPKRRGHLSITDSVAKVIQATIALVTGRIIQDDTKNSVVVPVRNDRLAPSIRCGQFVIVDLNEREPSPGALMWFRFENGNTTFARLGSVYEPNPGMKPHMRVNYGSADVRTPDRRPDPDFAGLTMGDSVPLDHLKTITLGRVIGILGDPTAGEAVDWRDTL